jgi:hypothetical protein
MDALMNALGYVGDALDKPGRAVRGVLAGKGREALSAVPFSDSMGLTDANERTSGRDLTDMYGLTRKGDRSFKAGALGFGAEMVTDPLNLLAGYGAFKAAPTLAKGIRGAGAALTGLDAVGALGRGARGLYRGARPAAEEGGELLRHLFHGEEGAVKAFPSDWGRVNPGHAGPDPLASMHQGLWPGEDLPPGLREKALAVGPRYADDPAKLSGELGDDMYGHLGKFLKHPAAKRLASEVPDGSKILGAGSEGLALKAGDGHVIRVGPRFTPMGVAGRPDIPEIVQPFRSQVIGNLGASGNKGPLIVEHMPEVHPVSGSAPGKGNELAAQLRLGVHDRYPHLKGVDVAPRNVSLTSEGRLIGHDPGMLIARDSSNPIQRYTPHPDVSPADLKEILRRGGPDEIRRMMMEGVGRGTEGQGIERAALPPPVTNMTMPVRPPFAKPKVLGDLSEPDYLKAAFADAHREIRPWWIAAQRASEEGIPMSMIGPEAWAAKRGGVSAGSGKKGSTNAVAVYMPRHHAIELNAGDPGKFRDMGHWYNPHEMQAMLDQNHKAGWWASNHPSAVIDHEIGHALHRDSVGLEHFSGPGMRDPMPDPEWVEKAVSKYATTNPAEFVAEIYSGLKGGREFKTPYTRSMFADIAGTPMMDRLSNKGLLKGLGWSVLGAAYGLHSHGQEPRGG